MYWQTGHEITLGDLRYMIKDSKAHHEQLKNPYERALVIQELEEIYGGHFAECWPEFNVPSLIDYMKQHNLTEEGLQNWKDVREILRKQIFRMPLTAKDVRNYDSRLTSGTIEEILKHDKKSLGAKTSKNAE